MSPRLLPRLVTVCVLALPIALTAVPAAASSTTPPAIDAERCAANQAAGPITFLTGFDFAAAASMIGTYVADAQGYYDDLCLDVEIVASFSTANFPLIASNQAQFASAGTVAEVLEYSTANEADLVVVAVEGRTPIDVLMVKPGVATELGDLSGATIGVKGKLPTSVAIMLAGAGLVEGEDFETVLLDGFDPVAHFALDIDGVPGYRSNEPGRLERDGVEFLLFDPVDYDIPGSFGTTYTSQAFIDENPTAAQDFLRATMKGLADAIADPSAATDIALELVTAGGNPNYLSAETEEFRWATDSASIASTASAEQPVGLPLLDLINTEVAAFDSLGLFTAGLPNVETGVNVELIASVYDDSGNVIW